MTVAMTKDQSTMTKSESNQEREQMTVLYSSENLGLEGDKSNWEQVKFIFAKVEEWLLERKQEALEQVRLMLEKLRHLYPRAYQMIIQMIHARMGAHIRHQVQPQPAHPPPKQKILKVPS